MKPFHFRLQTLLEFRKTQKEQVQLVFIKATNQLHLEQALLAEWEEKLSENIMLLRMTQQQSLSIEKLKIFRYYFDKISIDINNQKEIVMQAEAYCQECLEKLAEAEKNHKIVEKFREKKFQNYQLEANAEEQKLLDEIGLQIYTREK
jgi:flagellar FliJ protein